MTEATKRAGQVTGETLRNRAGRAEIEPARAAGPKRAGALAQRAKEIQPAFNGDGVAAQVLGVVKGLIGSA